MTDHPDDELMLHPEDEMMGPVTGHRQASRGLGRGNGSFDSATVSSGSSASSSAVAAAMSSSSLSSRGSSWRSKKQQKFQRHIASLKPSQSTASEDGHDEYTTMTVTTPTTSSTNAAMSLLSRRKERRRSVSRSPSPSPSQHARSVRALQDNNTKASFVIMSEDSAADIVTSLSSSSASSSSFKIPRRSTPSRPVAASSKKRPDLFTSPATAAPEVPLSTSGEIDTGRKNFNYNRPPSPSLRSRRAGVVADNYTGATNSSLSAPSTSKTSRKQLLVQQMARKQRGITKIHQSNTETYSVPSSATTTAGTSSSKAASAGTVAAEEVMELPTFQVEERSQTPLLMEAKLVIANVDEFPTLNEQKSPLQPKQRLEEDHNQLNDGTPVYPTQPDNMVDGIPDNDLIEQSTSTLLLSKANLEIHDTVHQPAADFGMYDDPPIEEMKSEVSAGAFDMRSIHDHPLPDNRIEVDSSDYLDNLPTMAASHGTTSWQESNVIFEMSDDDRKDDDDDEMGGFAWPQQIAAASASSVPDLVMASSIEEKKDHDLIDSHIDVPPDSSWDTTTNPFPVSRRATRTTPPGSTNNALNMFDSASWVGPDAGYSEASASKVKLDPEADLHFVRLMVEEMQTRDLTVEEQRMLDEAKRRIQLAEETQNVQTEDEVDDDAPLIVRVTSSDGESLDEGSHSALGERLQKYQSFPGQDDDSVIDANSDDAQDDEDDFEDQKDTEVEYVHHEELDEEEIPTTSGSACDGDLLPFQDVTTLEVASSSAENLSFGIIGQNDSSKLDSNQPHYLQMLGVDMLPPPPPPPGQPKKKRSKKDRTLRSKGVPMLAPPPEEKLKRWEDEKNRGKNYLAALKDNDGPSMSEDVAPPVSEESHSVSIEVADEVSLFVNNDDVLKQDHFVSSTLLPLEQTWEAFKLLEEDQISQDHNKDVVIFPNAKPFNGQLNEKVEKRQDRKFQVMSSGAPLQTAEGRPEGEVDIVQEPSYESTESVKAPFQSVEYTLDGKTDVLQEHRLGRMFQSCDQPIEDQHDEMVAIVEEKDSEDIVENEIDIISLQEGPDEETDAFNAPIPLLQDQEDEDASTHVALKASFQSMSEEGADTLEAFVPSGQKQCDENDEMLQVYGLSISGEDEHARNSPLPSLLYQPEEDYNDGDAGILQLPVPSMSTEDVYALETTIHTLQDQAEDEDYEEEVDMLHMPAPSMSGEGPRVGEPIFSSPQCKSGADEEAYAPNYHASTTDDIDRIEIDEKADTMQFGYEAELADALASYDEEHGKTEDNVDKPEETNYEAELAAALASSDESDYLAQAPVTFVSREETDALEVAVPSTQDETGEVDDMLQVPVTSMSEEEAHALVAPFPSLQDGSDEVKEPGLEVTVEGQVHTFEKQPDEEGDAAFKSLSDGSSVPSLKSKSREHVQIDLVQDQNTTFTTEAEYQPVEGQSDQENHIEELKDPKEPKAEVAYESFQLRESFSQTEELSETAAPQHVNSSFDNHQHSGSEDLGDQQVDPLMIVMTSNLDLMDKEFKKSPSLSMNNAIDMYEGLTVNVESNEDEDRIHSDARMFASPRSQSGKSSSVISPTAMLPTKVSNVFSNESMADKAIFASSRAAKVFEERYSPEKKSNNIPAVPSIPDSNTSVEITRLSFNPNLSNHEVMQWFITTVLKNPSLWQEPANEDISETARSILSDDNNFDATCKYVADSVNFVTKVSKAEDVTLNSFESVDILEIMSSAEESATEFLEHLEHRRPLLKPVMISDGISKGSPCVLAAHYASFLFMASKIAHVDCPFGDSNPFLEMLVESSLNNSELDDASKTPQQLLFEHLDGKAELLLSFVYKVKCSCELELFQLGKDVDETPAVDFESKIAGVSTPADIGEGSDYNKTDTSSRRFIVPQGTQSPFNACVTEETKIVAVIVSFLGDPVAVCRMKMINRFFRDLVAENEHQLMQNAVRAGGMDTSVRPAFWMWITLQKCDIPLNLISFKGKDELLRLETQGVEGKWHHVIERDVTRSFGNMPPHRTGARLRNDSIVKALVTWGQSRIMKRGVKGGGEPMPTPRLGPKLDRKTSSRPTSPTTSSPPWARNEIGDDASTSSHASETPTDTVSDWTAISPKGSFASFKDGESERFLDKSGSDLSVVETLALSGNGLTPEVKLDLQKKLSCILHTMSIRYEEIGYCQGMDYVVAHLLRILQETIRWNAANGKLPDAVSTAAELALNKSTQPENIDEVYRRIDESLVVEETIIRMMDTFFVNYNLRHMYWPELRCLKTCCRVFEQLIQIKLPVLADHMEHHDLNVGLFALGWFQTLFLYLPSMPSETVGRMWDIWLVERSFKIFFRVATAILFLSQPTLLNTELEGMMMYLVRRA